MCTMAELPRVEINAIVNVISQVSCSLFFCLCFVIEVFTKMNWVESKIRSKEYFHRKHGNG